MEHREVLIVGAGPIGLEVAWNLQSCDIDALVVDAGSVGETILRQFPPGTRFFSSPDRIAIAGIDIPLADQEKTTREAYLAYLRSVVVSHALDVRTHQRVESIKQVSDGFEVGLKHLGGQTSQILAKKLVLACGGTHRSRRLGIPGEDLPHVHNSLGDPHRFFQRRVMVVGGRNSAAESALRCWRNHAEVSISYRGDALHERVKYWIRPELQALIDEGRVNAHMPTIPVEISPQSISLKCCRTGEIETIDIDDVILQIGFEQDDAIFKLANVECAGDQHAPVFNPDTLETNVDGVFVAGTAVAGTQHRFKTYIETSHDHGCRIVAAMQGHPPPTTPPLRSLPEN
ncbi:MAG: NAD(P)-binding domain-containing protein [Phycisphaerales bacterium]|nr:NAD(P)-binding domain-containing protein [Phycisphaerales bacterium]